MSDTLKPMTLDEWNTIFQHRKVGGYADRIALALKEREQLVAENRQLRELARRLVLYTDNEAFAPSLKELYDEATAILKGADDANVSS